MSPTQFVPAHMASSRASSFDQDTTMAQGQLPSYNDAVANRKPENYTVLVSEKKQPSSSVDTKPRKTFQTLKSIILGDVYQHHPMRSMERTLDARAAQCSPSKQTSSSTEHKPRKTSTFKSIIVGDVYQHHPLRSMERNIDARSTR